MSSSSEVPAPTDTKRNRIWRYVRLSIFVYVGLCLTMMALETKLVYPRPGEGSPADWQISQSNQTSVSFTATDGTKLHGWYFAHDNPKYAILYCHGNGENISQNAGYMSFLCERLNASVFIFDYRGYGKSAGSPHEDGIILDGLAAQSWLAEKMQISTDDIVIMGRSIGGGVAVGIAEKQGARALVLQNTFASMQEVAADKYPWLPVRWMMRNQYPSAQRIQNYQGPLIQIHGNEDRIVPYAQGQKLFAAASTQNKLWIENKGQGHNEPLPSSYLPTLSEFLAQLTD